MKVLRLLTLREFRDMLSESGASMGTEKLKEAIKLSVFGDAAYYVPMTQDEFIIIKARVEKWIEENSVEQEMSDDVRMIAELYEESTG